MDEKKLVEKALRKLENPDFPPKCPECGKELEVIIESADIYHTFTLEEDDKYHMTREDIDETTLYCGKCWSELDDINMDFFFDNVFDD